jgi:hypothetical protein
MSQPINPPVEFKTSQTYQSYNVFQTFIALNTSALFMINIYDQSGNLATTTSLLMDGDAYKAWGGDDNYAYEWINSQIHNLK